MAAEYILVIMMVVSCMVLGIYALIHNYFFKPHTTSYVLKALFTHFDRITEKKAKIKNREFEVKTIRQTYYRVVISNLKVTETEPIEGFTIGDQDWYMRGKVDPVNLNQFSIAVREELI